MPYLNWLSSCEMKRKKRRNRRKNHVLYCYYYSTLISFWFWNICFLLKPLHRLLKLWENMVGLHNLKYLMGIVDIFCVWIYSMFFYARAWRHEKCDMTFFYVRYFYADDDDMVKYQIFLSFCFFMHAQLLQEKRGKNQERTRTKKVSVWV